MKFICFLVAFLFVSIISSAQFNDNSGGRPTEEQGLKFDKSKLYYGGYVNLSFGSYTVIGATPLIGYKISPQFSVGTQFTYEYFNDKRYNTDYSASNYGGSIFSRYRIVPQLYGHVEYSMMNYEFQNSLSRREREWVPFLFVGGGFSQPISERTWLNAQVLFDVIQDDNSPYEEWAPFWSVGIGVGF